MTPIQNIYKLAHEELDAHFKALYGKGRIFEWRTGRYKGRMCVVDQMFWEYKDGKFEVNVLVNTYKKKGGGFMHWGDIFNRTFHEWTPEKFAGWGRARYKGPNE